MNKKAYDLIGITNEESEALVGFLNHQYIPYDESGIILHKLLHRLTEFNKENSNDSTAE